MTFFKHFGETMEKEDYKHVKCYGKIISYELLYSCPTNAVS